jgi:hypothetical protein
MARTSVIYNLSTEEFKTVVEEAFTMTDILEKCGLRPVGSNRKTVQRRAEKENVSLKHLKSIQGKRPSQAIPLEKTMTEDSSYKSSRLKERLVKLGILTDRCSICGQAPVWNGKPLVLHLDHINGNHEDNRLENLRIVCPHCDSQLPTYKGRNKYHAPKPRCDCGAVKSRPSKHCRKCEAKNRIKRS